MSRMIIGVDPHKAAVTIEVIDEHGVVAATGRFPTDRGSYHALLTYARRWPHRGWAVEGAGRAGRPLARRLLADGERVLDVPAKLAARARVFDTGHGRKTDASPLAGCPPPSPRSRCARPACASWPPTTASWWRCGCWPTAVTSCPASGWPAVSNREQVAPAAGRADPRWGQARPVRAAGQHPARQRAATRRRRSDPAPDGARGAGRPGRRRRQAEGDREDLRAAVHQRGPQLMDLFGIGPAGAARLLAALGDQARFPSRAHLAAWNSHRTPGRLQRRADPPPPLPRRQPADQPTSCT
jgi:transposase